MYKLIKANIRKDRTVLLIFTLIIILSTFMLSISMMVLKYPDLFKNQVEETGTADLVAYNASYISHTYEDDIRDYFDNADYVESYTDIDIVMFLSVDYRNGKDSEEKKGTNWVFENAEDENVTDNLVFTERDDSIRDKKIYLNIYTAYSNNIGVGDKVYLKTVYGDYEYTVAGIYQDIFMGCTYTYHSALVEEDDFRQMQEDRDKAVSEGAEAAWNHMIAVHIRTGYDAGKCLKDAKDMLSGELHLQSEGCTNGDINEGNSSFTNILAGFMGAFAFLIIIICMIIIVFTINNNIGRDVTNIGALKAVGFTVNQIRLSLMMEYAVLSLIGATAGIGLSYAVYPVIEEKFIRQIAGVIWKNRLFVNDAVIILTGVLTVIVITTFFATARIRKLHPATALRFGLKSKAYKKNHIPLVKSRGELNFILAIKSFVQNKAQNLIVAFIMFTVAFVTMFSCVFYYNTQVDISKFQRMIMGDVSDAFFFTKDGSREATEETIENLKKIDEITDAYGISITYAYAGEIEIDLIYTTDPDALSFELCEGTMFSSNEETVIGVALADKIGVGVGDDVEISYGDKSKTFRITGLQQSPMNVRIYITDDAAEELGINTVYSCVRANVADADTDKVDAVMKKGEALGDSNITGSENQFKFQRSSENTPVFAVGFIVLLLVILNVVTILLVVRLLLKTVFVKREKEFGIKKALGFTSLQLRYQLSLSLIPSTLLAAALGAIAGYLFVNPMFGMVLRNYGVRSSHLIVNSNMMIIPIVAVTLLVFIFSFIMSGRMKRISAYKLIQE